MLGATEASDGTAISGVHFAFPASRVELGRKPSCIPARLLTTHLLDHYHHVQ